MPGYVVSGWLVKKRLVHVVAEVEAKEAALAVSAIESQECRGYDEIYWLGDGPAVEEREE